MFTSISRRILTASVAGASAVLLVACGGGSEPPANEPPPSPSPTDSVEPTTDTETVTETTTGTTTSTPDVTVPPDCGQGYIDSDFGAVTNNRSFVLANAQGENQDGFLYWANAGSPAEDGYEACMPLSFLVIDGMIGDDDGPAGTGASISEFVVLFSTGDTVSNPIPILMSSVEKVERTSPQSLKVTYGHRGGATAEGITERYDVTYTIVDGQVEVARAQVPDDVWNGTYRVRVP